MAEFVSEPLLVLETMEDVRRVVSISPRSEAFPGVDMWHVKSLWLVSIIAEIVAAGKYPYNSEIKQIAETRLGLPPKSHAEYSSEGDTLSLLIYNAQKYHGHDKLIASGYQPFTPELLTQAYETGKKIELFGSTLLGASATATLKPRMIDGKLYAMQPRKRNRHFAPQGQPVRLVA